MHKSSSKEQQAAAMTLFEQFCILRGLSPQVFQINEYQPLYEDRSANICPDFYSEEKKIIGEIHAHIGKLKPAQRHKIAADILKMLLFEKTNNISLHKVIVVCSDEEAEQLSGDSYLGCAIREYDVEVVCVPIEPSLRKELLNAQIRQRMINA